MENSLSSKWAENCSGISCLVLTQSLRNRFKKIGSDRDSIAKRLFKDKVWARHVMTMLKSLGWKWVDFNGRFKWKSASEWKDFWEELNQADKETLQQQSEEVVQIENVCEGSELLREDENALETPETHQQIVETYKQEHQQIDEDDQVFEEYQADDEENQPDEFDKQIEQDFNGILFPN